MTREELRQYGFKKAKSFVGNINQKTVRAWFDEINEMCHGDIDHETALVWMVLAYYEYLVGRFTLERAKKQADDAWGKYLAYLKRKEDEARIEQQRFEEACQYSAQAEESFQQLSLEDLTPPESKDVYVKYDIPHRAVIGGGGS